MKLSEIQAQVKVPKGQMNKFGNYPFRSCEDIIEIVKPIINPLGYHLILLDELVMIGNRFYIKATVTISNGKDTYFATGYARESESKKGMDEAQITGTASSYARKYALNGLFAIDDTKDADATNDHKEEVKAPAKALPVLDENHEKWNGAKKALKEGACTIEDIKKQYAITQYIIDKLIG
jgi:hypothetical protein